MTAKIKKSTQPAGFTKKFAVKVPTDSSLDELARNHVFVQKNQPRKILARRASSIPHKYQFDQPAQIQSRRQKSISENNPVNNADVRVNRNSTEKNSNTQMMKPARIQSRFFLEKSKTGTSTSDNSVQKIDVRRKSVSFGTNMYIDEEDYTIRMDRIRSLANISKTNVPSLPNFRNQSCLPSTFDVCELNNSADDIQPIDSTKNLENPEEDTSIDTNSHIPSIISPNLIDFSIVERSPSPLIDLDDHHASKINESCIVEPTQNSILKPKPSWVDILLSLNDEDNEVAVTQPILVPEPSTSNSKEKISPKEMICYGPHPRAMLPKKLKKPIPGLLPIERNLQSVRRRPSITARYLMAAIDGIDSNIREDNENIATDENLNTVSIISDDEFGKLHYYSDSE